MGQKNFSGKEQADTISCSKENNRETGKPIMKRKDPFFPAVSPKRLCVNQLSAFPSESQATVVFQLS
jgi:hypothetical protein